MNYRSLKDICDFMLYDAIQVYHLGIEENRGQIKAEIESLNFVLNRIRCKRVTPASADENTGAFIFHIIIVYY